MSESNEKGPMTALANAFESANVDLKEALEEERAAAKEYKKNRKQKKR